MSEKINIKKSYESSVGNTASEFSEINKRKTFSQREVGLNHPDNPGFIRLTDSGDIEIFAAPGVGLVINGTTKTVSIFAENIKLYTKEDGLKWNSMDFNHSATTFAEPAFVMSDDKSYNPAFLNLDYYISNLDRLEQEEEEKTVTINGSYQYQLDTESEIDKINLNNDSIILENLSIQDTQAIQEFFDKSSAMWPPRTTTESVTLMIKGYLDSGFTLTQAFDKVNEILISN